MYVEVEFYVHCVERGFQYEVFYLTYITMY